MTDGSVLVHICGTDEWLAAAAGRYEPASMGGDGFIHLSRPDQVHKPANRFYRGRDDLVLLVIDPAGIDAEIRWEPSAVPEEHGERFAHLYGSLPVAAVIEVVDFPADTDGQFVLPAAVTEYETSRRSP